MSKTVAASKFREWKGLDLLNQAVHEMHCIFREITKDDFGIDGEIEVVTPKPDGQGYQTTGGIIKVQVKSGESYVRQDSSDGFSTPVEKRDLELWNGSTFPVILVVYHPHDDKLYWKDVRTYVRSTPSVFLPPFHVAFCKNSDRFSADSYDCICNLASVSPLRISLQQRERLYSNLLLVKRRPQLITHATTSCKDIWEIRDQIDGLTAPICIHEGRLYTLADLRDPTNPLRQFCDTANIADMPADRWAMDASRERDYVYLLNQFLALQERRCGLVYNRQFKRAFFPRTDDKSLEFKRDWHNVRTGKPAGPRTVTKFYKYGSNEFWRHLAVNLSFKRTDTSWYLQIIPQYFFTTNGVTPWDSDKVGPYTTGIKARETNMHVLNHVLFWADVLAQGKPSIDLYLDSRRVMIIEKEPASGIAGFAIPSDPATFEEPDAAVQLDFHLLLSSTDGEGEDEVAPIDGDDADVY